MSAEVSDVSLIQDEDLLRRMVSDRGTLLDVLTEHTGTERPVLGPEDGHRH
jgi:hypothetical protein